MLKKQPFKIQTTKIKNLNNNIYDCAYINLKYKKNLNVLIKNSWVSPTKIRLIKIKFQKAILYCDENESFLYWTCKKCLFHKTKCGDRLTFCNRSK